jgi:predicted HicB family RNase H-like nuclease
MYTIAHAMKTYKTIRVSESLWYALKIQAAKEKKSLNRLIGELYERNERKP